MLEVSLVLSLLLLQWNAQVLVNQTSNLRICLLFNLLQQVELQFFKLEKLNLEFLNLIWNFYALRFRITERSMEYFQGPCFSSDYWSASNPSQRYRYHADQFSFWGQARVLRIFDLPPEYYWDWLSSLLKSYLFLA